MPTRPQELHPHARVHHQIRIWPRLYLVSFLFLPFLCFPFLFFRVIRTCTPTCPHAYPRVHAHHLPGKFFSFSFAFSLQSSTFTRPRICRSTRPHTPIRTLSLTTSGVSYFLFLLFCFTVIRLRNCRPTRPHTPLRTCPHTPTHAHPHATNSGLTCRFFFSFLYTYPRPHAIHPHAYATQPHPPPAFVLVCFFFHTNLRRTQYICTYAHIHHPHLSKCFLFLCFFFLLICVQMHLHANISCQHMHIQVHLTKVSVTLHCIFY